MPYASLTRKEIQLSRNVPPAKNVNQRQQMTYSSAQTKEAPGKNNFSNHYFPKTEHNTHTWRRPRAGRGFSECACEMGHSFL